MKYKKIDFRFSVAVVSGFAGALIFFSSVFFANFQILSADNLRLDEQEATVRAVKKVAPAVVSITVSENTTLSISLNGETATTSKRKVERGQGTGFLISADGLIITNKHVINSASDDRQAEYRISLASGKKYYAQLIGRDPLNDLAILKIFDKNLPFVELGDSDKLTPGVSVMAIGNVLGIYPGSVTKGIVSGLARDITASDQTGNEEALGNIIQTDAEINLGNSGGPLVDLSGKVVGINVAVDASSKAIGFAIPINDAKPVIKSARDVGRIIRPRLGVRYIMITPELIEEKKLSRDKGALVTADNGPAVLADSPAGKAGIEAGDIIFEINGIKLDDKNTLLAIVQRFKPGQKIGLKIQRGRRILVKTVELDEFR